MKIWLRCSIACQRIHEGPDKRSSREVSASRPGVASRPCHEIDDLCINNASDGEGVESYATVGNSADWYRSRMLIVQAYEDYITCIVHTA
jgi:hypothetical protein